MRVQILLLGPYPTGISPSSTQGPHVWLCWLCPGKDRERLKSTQIHESLEFMGLSPLGRVPFSNLYSIPLPPPPLHNKTWEHTYWLEFYRSSRTEEMVSPARTSVPLHRRKEPERERGGEVI